MDSNVAPDRISVEIVTAGAGTGKTHRITTAISAAVAGGLAPTGLLATTFTVKAATELQERVQAALAVCGRLLTEFALEAGLPPDLATLDETAEAAAFADAVSSVVAGFEPHVSAAALRLGLGGPDQDWRDVVRNIARAARANRLTPGEVIACGQRSLAGITGLLDAPLRRWFGTF